MTKYKYYRVTATSMSSYELYMKVPESITEDDIHAQRNDEILAGERYVGIGRDDYGNIPGDWELSDIMEVDEEEAKDSEDGYNADPLYKATAKDVANDRKQISLANKIGAIKAHFEPEKPDLTTIKRLIVALKSEKKADYDSFIKTPEGKSLIALENKLTKLKLNRR